MRVLGAFYGVTLVVSNDEPDASKPAKKKSTARRRSSAGRKARTGAPAAEAVTGKSKQDNAPRSSSPSNAEVRSWARETGLTVSDRGRVPASVMTAYRNTHSA